jgi:uncharacterized protein (DUF488 family)
MGRLLTVGHGTLDREALAALLTTAGTDLLVDVRRCPGSRHEAFEGARVVDGLLRYDVAE